MHTCTEAISGFFCDSVQKITKIVHFCWHLTASPQPPQHSIPENAGIFKSFVIGCITGKEQHESRDVEENLVLISGISYSPVFEERLLYSYYKMFYIVVSLICLNIYRNVRFKDVAWGRRIFCLFLRRGERVWKEQRFFLLYSGSSSVGIPRSPCRYAKQFGYIILKIPVSVLFQ